MALASGNCRVTSGYCFDSPNFPSTYGNGETCTGVATVNMTLSVVSFSLEAGEANPSIRIPHVRRLHLGGF
jgi:hypothetical protein